ncbi:MAG: metal ABC transporter substrate-binding protein [Actinomycetota bacterium]|nr:metal ABC transporter substrate-binding protein [Actinomycetota bacterium]
MSVTNLTPPGVEPHDLELTADDLEAIARADLVVYVGGGFQPGVEDAVRTESAAAVDALAGVEAPGRDGGSDPHAWLDPDSYASIVDRIAVALSEVRDGVLAPGVSGNAATLEEELAALDEAFRVGLADCSTRVMVTNHAAFAYLAAAYDLEQRAISGVSPGSEPDPARVAELADQARAEGVMTIFTEDLVSPEVAETLADEAGLETATLSPLEGLTEEQAEAGDDYLSLMRQNLEVLRDGLDCA